MVNLQNSIAYIDGANLHKGCIELGHTLDYKKFRGWLRQKFGISKAFLFLGLIPKHTKLYQHLQECGYILVFKETTTGAEGQIKGNCDAELVLKVICDHYEQAADSCIIVTGDGDFRCLIEFLKEKAFPITILAPNEKKCSILLKRTGVPLLNLAEHLHKFSRPIPPQK